MAGHSKWAQIKRQKGVNDAKRGQLFTRLGNAISIAAKTGGDPTMNPTLLMAIDKAKAANMPYTNIERAIKRGSGELGGEQIQEYLFEGYGPGGVGIIVEAASDNRNRTTSEVRSTFSKNGCTLAETGSVAFQFDRKGLIRISAKATDENMLTILDAGAEDVQEADNELLVFTELKQLATVKKRLQESDYPIIEAELVYEPKHLVTVTDGATATKIDKLIEAIEELDDVVNVYTNFEMP